MKYTLNFELSRVLKNDWSIAFNMPIESNTAITALDQTSGHRHTTNAYGIGDIRFAVYKWLWKLDVKRKGNLQAGLGIKFPTGKDDCLDYFYPDPNNPSARELAPIHTGNQLGDGGTGFTVEFNGFYIFNRTISLYGNFFYLISPMNQNGISNVPPGFAIYDSNFVKLLHQTGTDVNSVPDNYTIRAGANFTFDRFVATAGLRYEGAPAHDLIGKDDGLRQVGHIFSAEPGVQYKFRKSLLYSFVSIPFDRATIQTVPDKQISEITGQNFITGGHFANVLYYLGYAFTF